MCLENVGAEWNSSGTKRKPIKVQGDQEKKIAGAITMLICYETLDRYRNDYMIAAKNSNIKKG
jgi:predicted transcriptional regulator YdeE